MELKGAQEAVPDTLPSVVVIHAGLVLVSPFLPELFSRLGLVSGGEMAPEARPRALQSLAYLAEGRWPDLASGLVVESVLCGVAIEDALPPAAPPDRRDLATCDDLLRAVISQWAILHDTSLEGLRETFLRREGRLSKGADAWRLTIERKALDGLVDQVPWRFSLIALPSMTEPLHVIW
jgi:hypothetical protein